MQLPFALVIPDDVYRALGHILCQWAHLEQCLNEWLFALKAEHTDTAKEITARQQFFTRLGEWEKLAAPLIKKYFPKGTARKFCAEVRDLKEIRDEIAHGMWTAGNGVIHLHAYKYGVPRDEKTHDLDAVSLEQYAVRISKLNRDFAEYEKVCRWHQPF